MDYKKIFIPFLILPLLFSCTTHYIATWQNTDQESVITDEGNYAIRNDTIGISHSFNSYNGRVNIRMENYSAHPILVNLTKSAMTINGRTFGFVDGKATIYGHLNHYGTGNVGSFGIMEGTIVSNPNTLYIPPQAFVESEFTNIKPEIMKAVSENSLGQWTNYPVFDDYIYTRLVFYEEENAPLYLTSYINYSILDDDNVPSKTDIITQSFYLSSFYKIRNQGKRRINQHLLTRDDMSSYSVTRGYGAGLLLTLVGIGVLAAVLDIEEE
ncbi:hypothetical protein [Anditalea andensis]|uniref:Lipoprotein n=1 Tax=Anditalea andensis TaxID=1048983 RepID=A0A074KZX1_9BACT|nr:hypothetical protein [Anditalea andensis]KEO73765.1 hypothetical protein EL17_09635 [Anditalea andensis]